MKEYRVRIYTVKSDDIITERVEAQSKEEVFSKIYKNQEYYDVAEANTTYRIHLAHVVRITVIEQ